MQNQTYIFKIHPETEGAEKYVEILEDCDAHYVITKSTCLNAIQFCVEYDQKSLIYDVNYEIFEDMVNHAVIVAAYSDRVEPFEDGFDDIIFEGGGEIKRGFFD